MAITQLGLHRYLYFDKDNNKIGETKVLAQLKATHLKELNLIEVLYSENELLKLEAKDFTKTRTVFDKLDINPLGSKEHKLKKKYVIK